MLARKALVKESTKILDAKSESYSLEDDSIPVESELSLSCEQIANKRGQPIKVEINEEEKS